MGCRAAIGKTKLAVTISLPDYNLVPAGTIVQFQQIAEQLARWLPAGDNSTFFSHWAEAEWQIAEWLTFWQNALPWFVARLQAEKIAVPPAISERLQLIDQDSRLRTTKMLASCVEILTALQQANIPAMPLKGAVLAGRYYADGLSRPLGDLDIFIHPQDIRTAGRVLRQLGYTFLKQTAKEVVYTTGQRVSHPYNPDNIRPVELQHQALNEYGGLVHHIAPLLWQQSEEFALWAGVRCQVPRLAALFHHVVAHASEDLLMQRGKLMEINDIFTLAQAMSSNDWQLFRDGLTPAGARFLYPALTFSHQFYPLPIPVEIMSWLKGHTPPKLISWLAAIRPGQLLETKTAPPAWHEYHIAQLLSRSTADKSRTYFRLFFPPRWHFRMNKYPRLVASPFWPLSYLFINGERVLQLFKKS